MKWYGLIEWESVILNSKQLLLRCRTLKAAQSGEYLNDSYIPPCRPPPVQTKLVSPMSEKLLKVLHG